MGLRVAGGRRWCAVVLGVVLAGVPLLAAGPASAVDGNWWYDAYHVPQAQAAGFTGTGVKVAVIDGQIDPSLPVFQGAHLRVDPTPLCDGGSVTVSGPLTGQNFHGSSVTAMLIGHGAGTGSVRGIAPDAQVTFYGWGVPAKPGSTELEPCKHKHVDGPAAVAVALKAALASGAKIITTSVTLGSTQGVMAEVARAVASGVIVLSAVPDDPSGVVTGDLAWYNGVVGVNAIDSSGTLMTDNGKPGAAPNVETDTTVVAAGVNVAIPALQGLGVGASFATPLVAGMLADVWQKYPSATGNQLVQSLIHNTGTGPSHQPVYDSAGGFGFGAASLTSMLKVDPARYPDTNPLMGSTGGKQDGDIYGPSAAQVAAAKAQLTHPATSAPATPTKTAAAGRTVVSALVTGLVVGGIVLGILIVAGLVVLIIALSRRKTTQPDRNEQGGYA